MVDEQIKKLFEEFKTLTDKYADFDIEAIEYDIKRIESTNDKDLIANRQRGFTPKTIPNGDINWYTVTDLTKNNDLVITQPNTNKKTTINLIKKFVDPNNTGTSSRLTPIVKGDVLVSFKLTVGVVKVYNSTLPAYCSEAIDKITPKKGINSKFLAYYCRKEYPLYAEEKATGMQIKDELKRKIKIPIPKQINATYTSYKIQEILVEFIEYYSNRNNKGIKIINEKIFPRLEKIEKLVLPQFFDKEKTMCAIFNAYAKKNNYDVKLEDVEFEVKNTVDIGEFKGGSSLFTKKYINNNKGKYPVYSASTDIKTKGVSGYINTYEFDTAAIHITKNGEKTGTVFYFDKHKHSINGDRAIFLINEKLYNSMFIYLCLKSLELDKIHDWVNKLTKTKFEDYKIIIPKSTKNYTSYELQEIFADFIENYFKRVEKSKNISNHLINKYNEFTETVISRTLKA